MSEILGKKKKHTPVLMRLEKVRALKDHFAESLGSRNFYRKGDVYFVIGMEKARVTLNHLAELINNNQL